MFNTYTSIAADLERRIDSGEFGPGDKLPSYSELARAYEVSITTAQHAIRVLRIKELAIGHGTRGVFVAGADPKPKPRPAGTP